MKHMTKGGPGDKFLGNGKVDTSKWFESSRNLEQEIKDGDIWFCSAPFQLLYTHTDGELAPCSWAAAQQGPNIKNVSILEYFQNDNVLNQMRKEMTTPGSDLKQTNFTCYNCRHQEELYGRSRRQASMKIQTNDNILWPKVRNSAEAFIKDGRVHLQDRIFEVQIKAFGNQCNLDCYMCVPYDSTVRLKTMNSKELKEENVFSDYSKTKLNLPSSGKLEDVISQIVHLAPYIYNLKLIGGEPLVMKKFYTLLEKIVKTHSSTRKDYYNVYLNTFGSSSLDILFYIFFDVKTWPEELKARHDVNLSIIKLAESLKIFCWLHSKILNTR